GLQRGDRARGQVSTDRKLFDHDPEGRRVIGMFMGNDDGIAAFRVFAYRFQSFTDFSQTHPGVDQQADLIRADESAVSPASAAQSGYHSWHFNQCSPEMGQVGGYLLKWKPMQRLKPILFFLIVGSFAVYIIVHQTSQGDGGILRIGQIAPDFTAKDMNGKTV